jgi:hypothetical protein
MYLHLVDRLENEIVMRMQRISAIIEGHHGRWADEARRNAARARQAARQQRPGGPAGGRRGRPPLQTEPGSAMRGHPAAPSTGAAPTAPVGIGGAAPAAAVGVGGAIAPLALSAAEDSAPAGRRARRAHRVQDAQAAEAMEEDFGGIVNDGGAVDAGEADVGAEFETGGWGRPT